MKKINGNSLYVEAVLSCLPAVRAVRDELRDQIRVARHGGLTSARRLEGLIARTEALSLTDRGGMATGLAYIKHKDVKYTHPDNLLGAKVVLPVLAHMFNEAQRVASVFRPRKADIDGEYREVVTALYTPRLWRTPYGKKDFAPLLP